MEIRETAVRLAQDTREQRRQALEDTMQACGLAYEKQTQKSVCNYLHLPEDRTEILVTAHYDAMEGSTGANDNASSVAVLIALAQDTAMKQLPVGFAFTDQEETGSAGASLLLETIRSMNCREVITADLFGYGDTMALRSYGKKNAALSRAFLKDHHAVMMKYLPAGDDRIFSHEGIATLSCSVLPNGDVQALQAIGNEYGFLTERAPSYQTVMENLEVMETMHMGYRDDCSSLKEESLGFGFTFLRDLLIAENEKQRQ